MVIFYITKSLKQNSYFRQYSISIFDLDSLFQLSFSLLLFGTLKVLIPNSKIEFKILVCIMQSNIYVMSVSHKKVSVLTTLFYSLIKSLKLRKIDFYFETETSVQLGQVYNVKPLLFIQGCQNCTTYFKFSIHYQKICMSVLDILAFPKAIDIIIQF